MMKDFLGAVPFDLTALLVIIDPIGTAAIFAAMTVGDSAHDRTAQAIRAVSVAFGVLALFGIVGAGLLSGLGISIPALRIAGGILLFLTAADMVTAAGATRGSSGPERDAAIRTEEDISVFPLAIPLLAGPGAMTTMILIRSGATGHPGRIVAMFVALLAALATALAGFFAARQVARLLGATGANVIGRVLGVLLAALAAQITLDGLREAIGTIGLVTAGR